MYIFMLSFPGNVYVTVMSAVVLTYGKQTNYFFRQELDEDRAIEDAFAKFRAFNRERCV